MPTGGAGRGQRAIADKGGGTRSPATSLVGFCPARTNPARARGRARPPRRRRGGRRPPPRPRAAQARHRQRSHKVVNSTYGRGRGRRRARWEYCASLHAQSKESRRNYFQAGVAHIMTGLFLRTRRRRPAGTEGKRAGWPYFRPSESGRPRRARPFPASPPPARSGRKRPPRIALAGRSPPPEGSSPPHFAAARNGRLTGGMAGRPPLSTRPPPQGPSLPSRPAKGPPVVRSAAQDRISRPISTPGGV
jgi:hypothetical protein